MVKNSWKKMQVPIMGIIGILIIFSLIVVKLGADTNNKVGSAYMQYHLYDADFKGVQGCSDLYDPVCGSDGVTYDNYCKAKEAGVSVEYQGACAAQ